MSTVMPRACSAVDRSAGFGPQAFAEAKGSDRPVIIGEQHGVLVLLRQRSAGDCEIAASQPERAPGDRRAYPQPGVDRHIADCEVINSGMCGGDRARGRMTALARERRGRAQRLMTRNAVERLHVGKRQGGLGQRAGLVEHGMSAFGQGL